MISVWDSGDFAYQGVGVTLQVGNPPSLPIGSGQTYADRFGQLLVEVGDAGDHFLIPNKFTIMKIDGTLVEGWLQATVKFPPDVYSGNATLVQRRGVPLIRSQALVPDGNGATVEVTPEGGLQKCKEFGTSPVPCERYIDGRANPAALDFITTFTLPRPEQACPVSDIVPQLQPLPRHGPCRASRACPLLSLAALLSRRLTAPSARRRPSGSRGRSGTATPPRQCRAS